MFQSENDENRHFKLFEKLPDLKIQSEEVSGEKEEKKNSIKKK